jgi:hypothetical protein
MRRQRALAWAAVLALVFAVQLAPLPIGIPDLATAVLAQDATSNEASESTDLAVVALHCAEAPAADSLASYLATGAPPAGCAPAVGVAVTVTEDDAPLPGSPFATDVTGTLGVPVRLGSAVEVREDPGSLPAGYEPLAGEANGVPYANPVRLDSAVAGAAVLFVNVPAPVAALDQDAAAAAPEEATALAADTADADADPKARAATPALTCDPAYIAESNPAILPPAPKAGDIGGTVNSAPSSGTGGTAIDDGTYQIETGGDYTTGAETADGGNPAVSASSTRIDDGVRFFSWNWHRGDDRFWFARDRDDGWFVHGNGIWLWPRRIDVANLAAARSDTDNVAVVSNIVRIGNGVWRWPDRDDDWRQHDDSWMWRPDHFRDHDWRVDDTGLWVWLAAAQSGDDNVAVSASSVRIDKGVWFRPFDHDRNDNWFWLDRDRDDDRRWFDRDRDDDWLVHDKGLWRWPGRIDIAHLAAASSGDDNVAVVASAVRIDTGVWLLPPNRFKHGVWNWPGRDRDDDNWTWTWPRRSSTGIWIWSGAVARSGDNVAISASAVRIDTGLWLLPPSHGRTHDWLDHDDDDRGDRSSAESLTIESGTASEAPRGKLEQSSDQDESTSTADEALVVSSPSDDASEPPADSAAAPADATEAPGDGNAAPASEAAAPEADVESVGVAPAAEPAPDAVAAPADSTVKAPSDAGATDAGAVDPVVETEYVAPEPVVDSGYVAPAPAAEPVYVAPEPAADPGYVDPGYAEPAVDPGYVDPGNAEPTYVEATYVEPIYAEPEPVFEPVAIDPGNGDFGNDGFDNVNLAPIDVAAGSNGFGNSDFGSNEPAFVAPEPVIESGNAEPVFAADPVSVDPGNGGAGFGDAGNAAPDPGFGNGGGDAGMAAPDLGNAGPGNDAPAPISVDSGDGGGGFDGGNAAPDAGAGQSEGPADE